MLGTPITGKPGVTNYFVSPFIDVFYSGRDRVKWIAAPITIDGTLTGNALNTPYTFQIFPGTLFGRVTATGKYANSIIGKTTALYASGGTTLTVSAATANEIVRRIGTSGTFKATGPASAAGAVVVTTTTFSAINTTTGVITVTSLGTNLVTDSLIQPTDGSETILTLTADLEGIRDADVTNLNRVDVFDPKLWQSGGTLNDGLIQNWPTDTSTRTYIKAALKAFVGNATFLSDITG